MSGHVFEVRKDDLSVSRTTQASHADSPLAEGEARLEIESFAYTANNLTYAVTGDGFRYWEFFPTGDPAWGRIPAWGYARVIESRCADVPVGTRVYGYLPMATHLVVRPHRVSERGFSDGADHRASLHAVYNAYNIVAADPSFSVGAPALQPVFRPLFTTGFLLDAFFAENDNFGAEDLLILSASSKTALGMAHCMAARAGESGGGPRRIALTSPGNVAFVQSLGVYDEVVGYDAITALDARRRAAIIDFSGSGPRISALHRHYGAALVHSAMIGKADWDAAGLEPDLPGAKPALFFAPDHAARLIKAWGAAGFAERFASRWVPFLTDAADWIAIEAVSGVDALREAHLSFVNGTANPASGVVISP